MTGKGDDHDRRPVSGPVTVLAVERFPDPGVTSCLTVGCPNNGQYSSTILTEGFTPEPGRSRQRDDRSALTLSDYDLHIAFIAPVVFRAHLKVRLNPEVCSSA